MPSRIKQCAILVGGKGSRLGSETKDVPKPLLACPNRPFVAWQMELLARNGITEFVLLAGHLSHKVAGSVSQLLRYLPHTVSIQLSIEDKPLGTGGALLHARKRLDDRFLLFNGDTFFNTDFAPLLENTSTRACVLVRSVPDTQRYGLLTVNGRHVTAIDKGTPFPGLINSGFYSLHRSVLDYATPKCSLEKLVLPRLIKNEELGYSPAFGYFCDIGIPDDLQRARNYFSFLESLKE